VKFPLTYRPGTDLDLRRRLWDLRERLQEEQKRDTEEVIDPKSDEKSTKS
jgi:hypothetical protein